ncbi:MAG TPA: glycosyltransferase family 2 protein [Acidimicrobiales bacterium]|nr:glycosyltransferase family 2 protein [Acidimicrobiales bacterium]
MTADDAATVAAIVVNHNAGRHLVDCLVSLREAGVGQRIVVDNASSDGSRRPARVEDPAATWIDSGANLGYGRAANLGATSTAAPFLLVCNPDLRVRPDAVRCLVRRLDAEPDLGAVGPLIRNPDGTVYPSARTFPDLVDAIGHGALGLVAPGNRFTRRYRRLDADYSVPGRADWVSGACVLLRRQAWDAVGGFDPSFFMYLEDVDLCWRLHRAGWGVGFEPSAEVVHVQGVSAGRHPYRMLVAHHRSLWRFAWRTTDGARRLALPLVGAGLVLRLVAASAQHRLGGPGGRPAAGPDGGGRLP